VSPAGSKAVGALSSVVRGRGAKLLLQAGALIASVAPGMLCIGAVTGVEAQ
jgi:hypothetical protein